MARKTLQMEQYQCGRCGRVFYINKMDKSSLDLGFECPYGCDDSGEYEGDLKTEVEQTGGI